MKYSHLCEIYESLEQHPSRLDKTQIIADFLAKIKHDKDKEIIYLLQGRIFPDYDERELGISEQLAIKALSKATGITENEIEKTWKKLGDLGLVAEQITSRKKQSTLSSSELTTEKVLQNLQKLPALEGKGTVDKKMSLIAELLTSSTPKEAKYIIRIILSDMRIGTGAGTIRDSIVWACFDKEDKLAYEAVQDAYDKSTDWKLVFQQACKGIKELEKTELAPGNPVKVMLYPKVKSVEEAFERTGKPAAFEFKYDGFRVMINKEENGKIKLFTRRLDDVSKQFPDVIKYISENIKGKSFIIDGEAVGYDPKTKKYRPFQEISQRIKRKYDIEKIEKELPVEVIIFDVLYHDGKSYLKHPFQERRELLKEIVKQQKHKTILAEQIITDNEDKARGFFEQAIKENQEGLMVKKIDAPYKPGSRIGYGYKWKPEDRDFDLVIVQAEYGTGKRAGWLTSYTVACRDGDEFLEVGKVSTGLKEKEEEGLSFKEMTKILKPLIEKEQGREVIVKPKVVVAVTFQNIQKSPTYSSGFALRFPRITALRPDRNTDDITSLREIEKEAKKEG
jgi:DNA ligase 1